MAYKEITMVIELEKFPSFGRILGLPYIDIRVFSIHLSLIHDELAEKLINFYIKKLKKIPTFTTK